jgi:hypothetical protein
MNTNTNILNNPFRAAPPPLMSIGRALESVSALALECEDEAARALNSDDALAIARAKARIGGAKSVIAERLEVIERAHAQLAERHNDLSTGGGE